MLGLSLLLPDPEIQSMAARSLMVPTCSNCIYVYYKYMCTADIVRQHSGTTLSLYKYILVLMYYISS